MALGLLGAYAFGLGSIIPAGICLIGALFSAIFIRIRENRPDVRLLGLFFLSLGLGLTAGLLNLSRPATPIFRPLASGPVNMRVELTADSRTLDSGATMLSAKVLSVRSLAFETSARGSLALIVRGDVARRYQGERLLVDLTLKAGASSLFSLDANRLQGEGYSNLFWQARAKFRAALEARVEAKLGAAANLFKALFLGERSALDARERNAFTRAGLSHVMALSGFHLTIPAFILFFVLKPLGKRASTAIAIPVFLIYLALCGFPYSLTRAVLMMVIASLFTLMRRASRLVDVLGATFLLMAFTNPLAPYNLGYQLSFAAVLGILFLNAPFRLALSYIYMPSAIAKPLAVGLSAQTACLPILVSQLGYAYFIGVILTILVEIAMMILCILSALALVLPSLGVVSHILFFYREWLFRCLEFLGVFSAVVFPHWSFWPILIAPFAILGIFRHTLRHKNAYIRTY